MGHELAIAACLVLVFEGLLPFISPKRWRSMVATMATLDDKALRTAGLFCMMLGTLLLYLIN
ncbi:MAG: DUF2065 domain-containing protein [Pseudomonadales bacterium]